MQHNSKPCRGVDSKAAPFGGGKGPKGKSVGNSKPASAAKRGVGPMNSRADKS